MGKKKRKSYEELTFTDDFMFCKIMSTRPDLCKKLLELILGFKIERIEVKATQFTIEKTYDARGIRLDVYADDQDGKVYDIEMQTTKKKDLPKRLRYYQGMVDLNLIERSAAYADLKDTYIIFICTDDPFEKGLPVYTFEERCVEDPDLKLNAGSHKVVVNAKGQRENVSDDVKALLDYIANNKATDMFTNELNNAVVYARRHDDWRGEYMTLNAMLAEEREEGYAEGWEMGVDNGENRVLELMRKLYALGRKEDAQKAVTNPELRNTLYRELHIV